MAQGHDVRLFTVGESTCPVPRQWLFQAPAEPMGDPLQETAHVLAAYEALADTDIIHDHTELGPLLAGRHGIARQPVVTTIHTAVTARRHALAEIARHSPIVAISHAHARSFGDIPVAAVIHHGLDLDIHKPGLGTGKYLLFVGRMSADKGVHRAVRVARRAGWPLVIAAKIREPAERAYFDQQVRPLLGPDDDMLGEQPLAARVDLMRHASALVNPITWPEPFGLVMAEALAAATPVLAFPNGAAPEIIDHGWTGYLCESEEDMIAAVARAQQIDRWRCRAAAECRFSLARMAADYDRLYRTILDNPDQLTSTVSGSGCEASRTPESSSPADRDIAIRPSEPDRC
jgi:glycosyltransferase involved in cell wall biosynthesis